MDCEDKKSSDKKEIVGGNDDIPIYNNTTINITHTINSTIGRTLFHKNDVNNDVNINHRPQCDEEHSNQPDQGNANHANRDLNGGVNRRVDTNGLDNKNCSHTGNGNVSNGSVINGNTTGYSSASIPFLNRSESFDPRAWDS